MQNLTPGQKMSETYFNKSAEMIQYSTQEKENLIALEDTKEEIERMTLEEIQEYIKLLVETII